MTSQIITIGFNKNGEADFEISSTISDLSLEQMNELRAMVPVSIGTAEQMFRDGIQSRRQAAGDAVIEGLNFALGAISGKEPPNEQ